MHGVKSIVYQHYLHLGDIWFLAVVLGVAVVLGTWVAKRLVERFSPERFRAFLAILLVMMALRMLLFG
jgi:uncharacterized protein